MTLSLLLKKIILDYLKKTWMASEANHRVVFISAKTRDNIEELRKILYEEVKRIHITRYPYNNFLYQPEEQKSEP